MENILKLNHICEQNEPQSELERYEILPAIQIEYIKPIHSMECLLQLFG
jgi:hypothetical protein